MPFQDWKLNNMALNKGIARNMIRTAAAGIRNTVGSQSFLIPRSTGDSCWTAIALLAITVPPMRLKARYHKPSWVCDTIGFRCEFNRVRLFRLRCGGSTLGTCSHDISLNLGRACFGCHRTIQDRRDDVRYRIPVSVTEEDVICPVGSSPASHLFNFRVGKLA